MFKPGDRVWHFSSLKDPEEKRQVGTIDFIRTDEYAGGAKIVTASIRFVVPATSYSSTTSNTIQTSLQELVLAAAMTNEAKEAA